jgi:hypothetical protein
MRPARVRQTKATKESAKLFGKAVTITKILRRRLSSLLDPDDRAIINCMNKAVLKSVRSGELQKDQFNGRLSFLHGLDLNEATSFESRFKKQLVTDFTGDGKIILSVSRLNIAEDISAPSNAASAILRIAVASSGFDDPLMLPGYNTQLRISLRQKNLPAQKIVVPFAPRKDHITIIAASLQYSADEENNLVIAKKQWLPVALIAACWGKPQG